MKCSALIASILVTAIFAPRASCFTGSVTLGYPLDFPGAGVINPGLGEATTSEVVTRMGQTFVVPASHSRLASFSLWLADSPVFEPQATTFQGALMAWGGDRPTGQPLFVSASRTTTGLAHGEVRRFDFPVSVDLQPMATMVFFLDIVPFLDGAPNFTVLSSEGLDVYTEGTVVQSKSTGSLDEIASSAWQEGGASWDAVFRAEFRVVPEPEAAGLMSTVMGGMVALSRRARRERRGQVKRAVTQR